MDKLINLGNGHNVMASSITRVWVDMSRHLNVKLTDGTIVDVDYYGSNGAYQRLDELVKEINHALSGDK